MEFFINKNSTLPILKMELIKDGRNDFEKFFEIVQDSIITFSMTDINTGVIKVCKGLAKLERIGDNEDADCYDEFFITYQFTEKQTSGSGRYIGKFEIVFGDDTGKLIVPIREDLYINILDGNIKK